MTNAGEFPFPSLMKERGPPEIRIKEALSYSAKNKPGAGL
jgi:hypothetical protein